jgi:hypothetical protein
MMMLDYFVIAIVGMAGLAGGGAWWVVVGAAALFIDSWATLSEIVKAFRAKMDRNVASYYLASFGNALAACGAAWFIGYFMRRAF